MNFVKLELTPTKNYLYQDASSIAMNILGNFLSCDVRCLRLGYPSFQDWALDDKLGMGTSGNITFLEKEGDYIFLTDQCSQEEDPTELKMSRQQFVQLLNEWQEKVCKTKPNEVIITHENNEFIIKITD